MFGKCRGDAARGCFDSPFEIPSMTQIPFPRRAARYYDNPDARTPAGMMAMIVNGGTSLNIRYPILHETRGTIRLNHDYRRDESLLHAGGQLNLIFQCHNSISATRRSYVVSYKQVLVIDTLLWIIYDEKCLHSPRVWSEDRTVSLFVRWNSNNCNENSCRMIAI